MTRKDRRILIASLVGLISAFVWLSVLLFLSERVNLLCIIPSVIVSFLFGGIVVLMGTAGE